MSGGFGWRTSTNPPQMAGAMLSGCAPSAPSPSPMSAAAATRHRCQLFDVVTLLFEKRWLGADGVTIELTTKSEMLTRTAQSAFAAAFAAYAFVPSPDHGVMMSRLTCGGKLCDVVRRSESRIG